MKLVSLNIEGDNHRNTVIPFVTAEMPDVLCLQEIYEDSLSRITALGYTTYFLPCTRTIIKGEERVHGIALCSRLPTQNLSRAYYRNAEGPLLDCNHDDILNSVKRGIITADIAAPDGTHTIATTHFTWTPHGEKPDVGQTTDLTELLLLTQNVGPHMLCGDFNIPRYHSPLYDTLTAHYTDAVPTDYASSLDRTKHRLGNETEKEHLFDRFMVDYIFTLPPYVASDVKLVFGISDHAAVVATIIRDS